MLNPISGIIGGIDGFFKSLKPQKKEVKPIRVTKAGWYDPDVIKPERGQKVRIDCGQYGERDAVYLDPRTMLFWRLTDCTHPMQNMNMWEGHVNGWKPLDKDAIVTEDVEYEEVKPILIA